MSDEWETPKKLYNYLIHTYNFYPTLDVCATRQNKKCLYYFGMDAIMQKDGLKEDWYSKNWCNPPHSQTELWVIRALELFQNHHNETMMIIPANSMCTDYAEVCILPHAEWHPINRKYCKFLQDGEEKDPARNGYFVVIWRRK